MAPFGPATWISAGRNQPESLRLSPKFTVCEKVCAAAGNAASARAAASRLRTGRMARWFDFIDGSLGVNPSSRPYRYGWPPGLPDAFTKLHAAQAAGHPSGARAATSSAPRENVSMDIRLNGQPRALDPGASIADLLRLEGLAERRVAVEVNGDIVPRSGHATHALSEGDRVEVVHALGGG